MPGPVNYRALERAIKALYATGQFDDVQATCDLDDGRNARDHRVHRAERPLLGSVDVTGTGPRLAQRSVRDRVDLLIGRPLDPAQVARRRCSASIRCTRRGILPRAGEARDDAW